MVSIAKDLETLDLSLKSPSVSPSIPSSSGLQSNEISLNLGMKCWNSAVNAQGSRVIIVVQVGAVKTYVARVQALLKKETQDETQFTMKIGGKPNLGPSYVFDVDSALNSHPLIAWLYGYNSIEEGPGSLTVIK
jgi:hypothetical protein